MADLFVFKGKNPQKKAQSYHNRTTITQSFTPGHSYNHPVGGTPPEGEYPLSPPIFSFIGNF